VDNRGCMLWKGSVGSSRGGGLTDDDGMWDRCLRSYEVL